MVANGVKVDDENNEKLTSLDLCYNLEMFKALAEYARPETLEKKLRHILENEDLADEETGDDNIIKFLLIEKNVKIDLNHIFNNDNNILPFYDIVMKHGNEEQKKFCYKIDKCKEAIKSFLSPFF